MTTKVISFAGTCPVAQLGDPTLDAKEILALMNKQLDIMRLMATHYVFIPEGTHIRDVTLKPQDAEP